MKKYRISPSTLDKFQALLDAEAYFESDYNFTDDGPKQSLEEITAQREQELIDAINKVPQAPSVAASQGTAFNECVDQMIRYKYWEGDLAENYDHTGKVEIKGMDETTITAACEGFQFCFDRSLVEKVADIVKDGTMQLHCAAFLDIDADHRVLLHGFPDYIQPRQITDLKTTSSYTFGKYERYWQRYVYPYVCRVSNYMQVCDAFEFLAVELNLSKKTGIISGEVAREAYTDVSVQECAEKLRWVCGAFIEWLEAHKEQITSTKIFGL